MANPSLYVSNPIDVFKLNFENLKIAEFCVKHKKRIVQFSTCEACWHYRCQGLWQGLFEASYTFR